MVTAPKFILIIITGEGGGARVAGTGWGRTAAPLLQGGVRLLDSHDRARVLLRALHLTGQLAA